MRRAAPLLCLAVLAAGCGSVSKPTALPAPPPLPGAVAARLAAESDAVAAAIASGDACRAQELGSALRADVDHTLPQIPSRYQEQLSSGVNELLAELPSCVRVTVPDQQPFDWPGLGKGKGHGHHGKHGEGD